MVEKIITANWKMYKTIPEATRFVEELIPLVAEIPLSVCIAVPFTALALAAEKVKGTKIRIGAQNMNDASEGAFTGEIAASMLVDAGASFVLLGHSERRHYFNETNAFIHRKVLKAQEVGLQPVLCVGETKEDREAGHESEVVKTQLTECLASVKPDSLMIAYEPLWAIGTGVNATPGQVETMHATIRATLSELFGAESAAGIPIQYGGSVTTANAQALLDQPDLDGLLVGGASLSFDTFRALLQSVTKSELKGF